MASLARTLEHSSGSLLVGQAGDPVLLERADGLGAEAEIGDGRRGALGHRVHHAGLGQHVDQVVGGLAAAGKISAARRPARQRPLHHAVGQQLVGDAADLRRVEVALDQIARSRR